MADLHLGSRSLATQPPEPQRLPETRIVGPPQDYGLLPRGLTGEAGVYSQRRTHLGQAARYRSTVGSQSHLHRRPRHPGFPTGPTQRITGLARWNRRTSNHTGGPDSRRISSNGPPESRGDLLGEQGRPLPREPPTNTDTTTTEILGNGRTQRPGQLRTNGKHHEKARESGNTIIPFSLCFTTSSISSPSPEALKPRDNLHDFPHTSYGRSGQLRAITTSTTNRREHISHTRPQPTRDQGHKLHAITRKRATTRNPENSHTGPIYNTPQYIRHRTN